MKNAKVTIQEIARLADVSPAAVSIVLNNKSGVSEATRKRVLEIALENGYSRQRNRNGVAPGNICFLKYTASGVLVENNDGFITEIIDAIELELRKLGLNLILNNVTDESIAETLKSICIGGVSGIIVLGTELGEEAAALVAKVPLPMVVIDNYMPSYNMNCVVMNNQQIVRQAIDYLYQLGHRSIGYLRSSIPINNFIERNAGFHSALEALAIPYEPEFEHLIRPSISDAYSDVCAILEKDSHVPAAFFCDNDSIAIGAIKAFKKFGYQIPQDVSFVGFDDIASASVIDPALTTLRVYRIDIAKWAVQLLTDTIQNPHPTMIKILTSAKLKVRRSACEAKPNA